MAKAPFAVLVFAWNRSDLVLCDIQGRGWCVPSGRIEEGEEAIDAARREAIEESSVTLDELEPFGCFRLEGADFSRWSICYRARVCEWLPFIPNEESRGRQCCSMEELPRMYYLWNELIKAVFDESRFL